MLVMLAVIGMMIFRARDEDMWRWFTGEEGGAAPAADAPRDVAAAARPAGKAHPAAPDPADAIIAGPTDRDKDEAEAAREEFQALEDKTPLKREEMVPYWRVVRWAQHESFQSLERRAKHDVSFADIYQRPAKYRGKLLRLQGHLRQTVSHDDIDSHAAPDVKRIYELRAWNSDSQPYSYILVTTKLPRGMPEGPKVAEEITFVGYFLKLMAYEDHEGKHRATPLLIGRVHWRPTATPTKVDPAWGDVWPWALGGVLAVLFVVRWASKLLPAATPPYASRLGQLPQDEDHVPVETWLEHVEESDSGTIADTNGHSGAPRAGGLLDWNADDKE